MNPPRTSLQLSLLALLALAPALSFGKEPAAETKTAWTPAQIAFFETNVRPVLVERCVECHSGEEPENGLSVESREALLAGGKLGRAVVPGKPTKSLLISAINHDEFLKMPPKEKLATRHVIDLTRWVKMGAPWPKSEKPVAASPRKKKTASEGPLFTEEQKNFWAFRPVQDPRPPQVADQRWPRSPLDHFVLARLEAAGLKPAPPADKRTLIRRATFDLIGLPPTSEEIDNFLRDESPRAFARVIDRLLASPRYGERWGRHWLDVARYADSNGLDENLSYANAYRYRDYVISAFNQDKPYARFVQEQIAGDLLPEHPVEQHNLERLIATSFLAIGPKMLAEDDPVKMQMDIIDEQLSTLGQAFLGLTFGCARCHDHKFDPLPTEDYYSLAGIFKSSKTMENHKVVAVWYERPLVTSQREAEIKRIDAELERRAKLVEALRAAARKNAARNIRRKLSSYLLAEAAMSRLQKAAAHDKARTKQDKPFAVKEGYALLEAEAFHRGNVSIVTKGYGEGIGIIGTSGAGFAEYDLEVEHAGEYALEARFAAADSRPVSLIVNGAQVAAAILGNVTGTWYPDSQRWTAEARFELKAGKNTIKLDSPRVYPHIDKLAVVYAKSGPWPFESAEPSSITRASLSHGVEMGLLALWQDYFGKLESGKLAAHHALRPWIAFRKLDPASFQRDAAKVLAELQTGEGVGKGASPVLKKLFAEAPPQSLADVAKIFQSLIDLIDDPDSTDDALKPLREEFDSDASPLSGPKKIVESSLDEETRRQLADHSSEIKKLKSSRPKADVAMGVTEGKAEDIRIHLRGSHITLGRLAPRRFPRILAGKEQPVIGKDQSGRLQLAQWLTRDDHPLLHRVLVNRIWRWRFGRGLVSSVDNFGALGQRPTHPRLLDWLSRRFIESGGSIKAMHRLMMLSSTYRMSTRFDQRASEIDPENRLLWRVNRRRLSGEELRDSVIELGPGLDLKMGGSLLKVKNRGYVTVSGTNVTDEYRNRRRTVYLPVVRSSVYDVLQTLDFPDPAVSNGDRQTTTIAPQALLMMNSELVTESTRALAARLMRLPNDDDRIVRAYQSILGRDPSSGERTNILAFLERAKSLATDSSKTDSMDPAQLNAIAWRSVCRVLLSSNEFVYVE